MNAIDLVSPCVQRQREAEHARQADSAWTAPPTPNDDTEARPRADSGDNDAAAPTVDSRAEQSVAQAASVTSANAATHPGSAPAPNPPHLREEADTSLADASPDAGRIVSDVVFTEASDQAVLQVRVACPWSGERVRGFIDCLPADAWWQAAIIVEALRYKAAHGAAACVCRVYHPPPRCSCARIAVIVHATACEAPIARAAYFACTGSLSGLCTFYVPC